MLSGKAGDEEMDRLMEQMRIAVGAFPALDGLKMTQVDDYQCSQSYFPGGSEAPISLPCSNALKMTWENGTSMTIRPSGTEPKLKVYLEVVGKNEEEARCRGKKMAVCLKKDFGI